MNRYYNPKTGRYLQADPIGLEGGQNMYNYVNNNPLIFSDTSGLSPQDVILISQIFKNTVQDMTKNHRRLPGRGDLNNNNDRAYVCNRDLEMNFPIFGTKLMNYLNPTSSRISCKPEDSSLLYCQGQVAELNTNLSALLYKEPVQLKGWSFHERNSSTHFWLLAVPKDPHDPYIWMDPWKNQFSIGKPLNDDTNNLPTKGM